MADYCDLDPHVRLSEAAEYTGIGIKAIQKYISVERLIQPSEPPEKEGGWFLFGRMDFTRLLIIKKLVENGMPIPDVRNFMEWLDGSRVLMLRHTRRLQHLQEQTDNPNMFEINFETQFGHIYDWKGGEPPPYRNTEERKSPDGDSKGREAPGGVLNKVSMGRMLNYDPFPYQIPTSEFHKAESGYPRPPVETSGWLQYWKSVRQIVHVEQYLLKEKYPKYPVLHLLLPERILNSKSKASKYTKRWGYRILGEITMEILKHEATLAISSVRFLNLAQIKAEVADRILNPPEAIRRRHRES